MHFLRTLFWVVVAVLAVIFSIRNWTPIVVHLWGGLDADIKLPVLLLIAFLIGFLPWFTLHKATRWQFRRRLEAAQRALDEERNRHALVVDPAGTSPLTTPPPAALP
jgi:uncharacterized integral membrane protein